MSGWRSRTASGFQPLIDVCEIPGRLAQAGMGPGLSPSKAGATLPELFAFRLSPPLDVGCWMLIVGRRKWLTARRTPPMNSTRLHVVLALATSSLAAGAEPPVKD